MATHNGDFEIRDYPALSVAEMTMPGDRILRPMPVSVSGGISVRGGLAKPSNDRASHRQRGRGCNDDNALAWALCPLGRSASSCHAVLVAARQSQTIGPSGCGKTPTRFAVLRFSGLAGDAAVATKTGSSFPTRHLVAAGPPIIAQYNPPWTPWFMRRTGDDSHQHVNSGRVFRDAIGGRMSRLHGYRASRRMAGCDPLRFHVSVRTRAVDSAHVSALLEW